MLRVSFGKRQKELQRKERKNLKDAKRQERAKEKELRGPRAPGEDPDIAGIIPGPQPRLEE